MARFSAWRSEFNSLRDYQFKEDMLILLYIVWFCLSVAFVYGVHKGTRTIVSYLDGKGYSYHKPKELKFIAPLIVDCSMLTTFTIIATVKGVTIFGVIIACAFLYDALWWIKDYFLGKTDSDGYKYRYGSIV